MNSLSLFLSDVPTVDVVSILYCDQVMLEERLNEVCASVNVQIQPFPVLVIFSAISWRGILGRLNESK
jgi:hypothetical protein